MAGSSFNEPPFLQTALKPLLVVLTIHIVFIASLQFNQTPEKKAKIEKPLEVKTIILNASTHLNAPKVIGAKSSSGSLKPQAKSQEMLAKVIEKNTDPITQAPHAPEIKEKSSEKIEISQTPKLEAPKKETVKTPPPKVETAPKKEVVKEAKKAPPPKPEVKAPKKEEAVKKTVKPAVKTPTPPKPVAAAKTSSTPKPATKAASSPANSQAKTPPTKNSPATVKAAPAKAQVANKPEEPSLSKAELELLASLQASVSKLGSSSSTSPSSSKSSAGFKAPLDSLGIEKGDHLVSMSEQERDYKSDLIYKLKRVLRLPEIGDVKIELTISREGRVLKMAFLKSESEKNKSYVEKQLTALSLPSFEERFKGLTQKTFTITLSNDL